MIYLDNAATTRVDNRVVEAMIPYFTGIYGNPSAPHPMGRQAREDLETARDGLAGLIGAASNEIIFTSGGTEADNLAILSVAATSADKGKHIITSSIEHHAVLEVCHALERRGYRVTYLPVDKHGQVSLDELRRAIAEDTILISIMAANNVMGSLQPVRQIGAFARERGILFHTDAVQMVGHLPVSVDDDNVDMLSISAHKFGGPKGVGALYAGRNVPIAPIIYGGGQEEGLRSGTENVPGIIGLGKAAVLAMEEMEEEAARLTALRNKLEKGILKSIPNVVINGNIEERLPGNLNISIHGVEGEYLVKELGAVGLCVSTGSACSSAIHEAPYVLLAMGVERDMANCSIRLSLGKANTEEETSAAVRILAETVQRIRSCYAA